MDLTAQSAATERLRRASLGSLIALLIQYGLGMGVNLYVNVPKSDQGQGIGAAFGKALSHGPAALAVHTGVGLLLIVNVVVVLVLAIRTRLRAVMVSAIVGLVSLLGAAFSGVGFVDNGATGASMAMALLAGVALACYATNLYVLGARRTR